VTPVAAKASRKEDGDGMAISLVVFGLAVSALSAAAQLWSTRQAAVEPARAIGGRSASRGPGR
jgi:hypothetical protein